MLTSILTTLFRNHKMNNKIDRKIKGILSDLHIAHKRKEKFAATDVLDGKKLKPKDPFEMGLAFAEENRLLIELKIARSLKYPKLYSKEDIKQLESERDRLTHRVRAFQNRQFPSQYRE